MVSLSIIPIKVSGTSKVSPYGTIIPRSISCISVIIGKPIKLKADLSYEDATKVIEKHMVEL